MPWWLARSRLLLVLGLLVAFTSPPMEGVSQ